MGNKHTYPLKLIFVCLFLFAFAFLARLIVSSLKAKYLLEIYKRVKSHGSSGSLKKLIMPLITK